MVLFIKALLLKPCFFLLLKPCFLLQALDRFFDSRLPFQTTFGQAALNYVCRELLSAWQ